MLLLLQRAPMPSSMVTDVRWGFLLKSLLSVGVSESVFFSCWGPIPTPNQVVLSSSCFIHIICPSSL